MDELKFKSIMPDPVDFGTPKTLQGRAGNGDFAKVLGDSLKEVNNMQLDAHKSIQMLATGNHENIHETMIAVQKAKVSFQLMMQIRNKIIDAYQEILQSR